MIINSLIDWFITRAHLLIGRQSCMTHRFPHLMCSIRFKSLAMVEECMRVNNTCCTQLTTEYAHTTCSRHYEMSLAAHIDTHSKYITHALAHISYTRSRIWLSLHASGLWWVRIPSHTPTVYRVFERPFAVTHTPRTGDYVSLCSIHARIIIMQYAHFNVLRTHHW